MNKNKLMKDMNMHPEVIDLCEDENTVINMKDVNVNISSEPKKTKTNNGERKILKMKANEPEINWDLLEMESDHEQVKSQKESQESDNSLSLIEVGSGSLPFSSKDEDVIMMEGGSLVQIIDGGRENGDMKGLSKDIVVSSNESMVGLENMRVQLTNENRVGLVMSSEYSSVIIDAAKNCESEKSKQLDVLSEHKLRDINSVVGLNENSDSGTSTDLKDSSSISFVHSVESEDNLEKLDFVPIFPKKDARGDEYVEGTYGNVDVVLQGSANYEVLPKDGEAQYMGDQVDHEKLNLEGGNAISSVVGGDSDMNGLELTLYTSLQDTPVSVGQGAEINRDLTNLGPTLTSVLDSQPLGRPRKEKKNMNDLEFTLDTTVRGAPIGDCQGGEINRDQADLETALRSVPDSKSLNRRGRPRKEKTNINDGNADSAFVDCNIGESSSFRRKRVRRESKYLSFPYTSVNENSPKRPRKEDKKVKKAADGKAEWSAEQVLLDLIAVAQGPLNAENSILTRPKKDLVISFRDSLSSKDYRKSTQEVVVAPSPVLLDARVKLEDMIMSLNGSDVESKESLIRDTRGLLEKVNLALINDGATATEFYPGMSY